MVVLTEIMRDVAASRWMSIDLPLDRPLNLLEKKIENYLLTTFDFYEYARSLQEAKRLEENRLVYFQRLYREINCRSNPWGDICDREWKDVSTHGQVFQIIEAKENYDRRIKKLKKQYGIWRKSLTGLDEEERKLMRRYYEGGFVVLTGEVYEQIESIKEKIDYKFFRS